MWDVIVLIPDLCLSIYFIKKAFFCNKIILYQNTDNG